MGSDGGRIGYKNCWNAAETWRTIGFGCDVQVLPQLRQGLVLLSGL